MSRLIAGDKQDELRQERQAMTSLQTQGCPHLAAQHRLQAGDASDGGRPRLLRISEVEQTPDPESSLPCIAQWVREFLARPHPQLGRKGSVCPFVPLSLTMDTIWLAEVSDPGASFESISKIITEYRDLFLAIEPKSGPDAMQKSFLIVFPALAAHADGPALVDEVQYALKKYFVDMGLMLGEFHSENESGGLRNPDFRPLRSPVPMLAIRYMVESDLPFLMRESYPPQERSAFLRSYLSRVGGNLSPAKFEQVLDRLIAAEIELWVANATTAAQSACVQARAEEPSMGVSS